MLGTRQNTKRAARAGRESSAPRLRITRCRRPARAFAGAVRWLDENMPMTSRPPAASLAPTRSGGWTKKTCRPQLRLLLNPHNALAMTSHTFIAQQWAKAGIHCWNAR